MAERIVMKRRGFLILAGASSLTGCGAFGIGGEASTLAPNSRIVIVRHMDRTGEPLNETGIARAAALPAAIADIPLDDIYAAGIPRNMDSAAPLAAARGLETQSMFAPNIHIDLPPLAAGRSVIWIGNSNNLNTIWEAWSLPGEAPTTYGDIAVVETDAAGRVTVTLRRVEA